MPPGSSSGTCSVSRRSESGSYSTTAGLPAMVAAHNPRRGSGAVPFLWVFLITGMAASSRWANPVWSSFSRLAVSFTPWRSASASTCARKVL